MEYIKAFILLINKSRRETFVVVVYSTALPMSVWCKDYHFPTPTKKKEFLRTAVALHSCVFLFVAVRNALATVIFCAYYTIGFGGCQLFCANFINIFHIFFPLEKFV